MNQIFIEWYYLFIYEFKLFIAFENPNKKKKERKKKQSKL